MRPGVTAVRAFGAAFLGSAQVFRLGVTTLKGELAPEMTNEHAVRRDVGAVALMFIAQNLERIADHATNIAEDVLFLVKGIDVRHHAETREP